MKIITSTIAAAMGVLAVLRLEVQANYSVYEDTQICTISDSIVDWDMSAFQYMNTTRTGAPFYGLDVLDLRTLAFADQSSPEVFGFARQGNHFSPSSDMVANPTGKKGGYSHLTWWNTGNFNAYFNRGAVSGGAGTRAADNFYASFHATNGFYWASSRKFKTSTGGKKRASMKIDYLCNTPSSLGYTIWDTLGVWDMSSTNTLIKNDPSSEYGVAPGRIIDLGAVIRSDLDGYGYATVHTLEHLVSRYNVPGNDQGRGGALWVGLGCRTNSEGCNGGSGSSTKLRLFSSAPTGHGYTGADYGSAYSSTGTPNRGWVKIQYTGPKATTKKIPYAMKTRVIATSNWDMSYPWEIYNQDYYRSYDLPLYYLRINERRVTHISTVILSDPAYGDNDRVTVSNFHRPINQASSDELGGGMTYISGSEGVIRLAMIGGYDWTSGPPYAVSGSFYANNPSGDSYSSGSPRAHVSVDYLAGSCTQGPNALEIDYIPSGPKRTGNCNGSSQPFLLQGTGDGSGNTLVEGASEDAFTFFSKRVINDGTKIVYVKVNSVDANNGWAGVTMRYPGKGKNYSHATLMVDAYGNVKFITRNGTGNANVLQATGSTSFPAWIGLLQDGSKVVARVDTRTTPPEASGMENSWNTEIGEATGMSNLLAPEEFDIGMVVTNDDQYPTYDLTNASMSYFNEEW